MRLIIVALFSCLLTGCGMTLQITPHESGMETIEKLAHVNVRDVRTPGAMTSRREVQYGMPSAAIKFDPPETEIVKNFLEIELSRLLQPKGEKVRKDFDCDLVEFAVYTATTPLYWDVKGQIKIILKHKQLQHDLLATQVDRTYIWPGEAVMKKVIEGALDQIKGKLPPVVENM